MTRLSAVVIDDDVELSELFKSALELNGFDVSVINDSRQAIAHLRETQPQLITLDMQMPHMTGVEVLRQIRADEKIQNCKIIMISASGQINQYKEIENDADVVLSKPLSLQQLGDIVKRLVPAINE